MPSLTVALETTDGKIKSTHALYGPIKLVLCKVAVAHVDIYAQRRDESGRAVLGVLTNWRL